MPPSGSTTSTVRFTAGALGTRTAALRIASNVSGSANPFDINLTGTGLTELENWRQSYFGSPANAGLNLREFIAGLSPVDLASRFNLRIEAVSGQAGQKAIIFSPAWPIAPTR